MPRPEDFPVGGEMQRIMAESQWAGKTFGNGWMHRNLIRLLRFTDVRILYVFSDIFIVPVCLLLNESRKTAYSFYRRRLGCGVLRSCWMTWRNHCLFAQVVIDRFAMYAGKRFDVEIAGEDYFRILAAKDEGFVQLSSHVGNYEIAGYSINSGEKMIHAVVYAHEKESVMRNRDNMFTRNNVSMIALRDDMGHLFEIDGALGKGDIVSFPADRHTGGSRCLTVGFLGAPARFPQGPFSVAAMRGVEALAVNVMKAGTKKYRIHLARLNADRTAPRRKVEEELCRAYVAELEKIMKKYPLQWFNFFDFWA